MSEKRKMLKAAGLVGALTLLSRFTGLLRDAVLAAKLGATGLADTFLVAFEIPNLIRRAMGEGALSAFMVPLFTKRRKEQGSEAGWRFFNTTANLLLILAFAVTLLGGVFSQEIYMAFGGFGQLLRGASDPGGQNRELIALGGRLTRIMFPFAIGLTLASLMMGACHTLRSFGPPSLGSVMLNLSLIAVGGGAILLHTPADRTTIWLCWAVLAGAVLRVLIMVPTLARHGWRWRPVLTLRDPDLRRLMRMMGLGVLALSIHQINIIVAGFFALYLGEGIKVYITYSNRLIQFPMALTASAVATAMLPQLSQYLLEKRTDELRDMMAFTKRLEMVLMMPAVLGLMVLGEPIMSLIFERLNWTPEATRAAYWALLFYAPALLPMGWARLLVQLSYARQDLVIPLKAALAGMVVNVALNYLFAVHTPLDRWGVPQVGLALAFTLGAFVNYWTLALLMRRAFGPWVGARARIGETILKSAVCAAGACALAGGAYAGLGSVLGWPGGTLARLLMLLPVIMMTAFVYFGLARLIGVPDSDRATKLIVDRLHR